MKHKVLVVATSHKTRGGITSVVKAHEMGPQWGKYHCKWIETHIDKNKLYALWYFFKSFIMYLIYLPSATLVHIHLSEPGSAIRKLFYFIPAYVFNKKIIVHFHSFSTETTINGKFRAIYSFLFSHADVVVVLSNFWKKEVETALHINNVCVIYNPCMSEKYDTNYSKKNTILYAGTLNERKGFLDLIQAFSLIAKRYRNWKIVFAGNGNIREGMQLATELKISTQVEFLGWVSGKEKDRAFKEASIFCLPSYAEGFAMSVLDAWSYELPVITTPVGGIPDVAEDGKNMLLFNPGDTIHLAELMSKLIDNKALRVKISLASKRLAENTFNLDEVNRQIGLLYAKYIS